MHVVDMVLFWARAVPHRMALLQPDMVTTFEGLADAIESIGDRIDRLNLDSREPVAVAIANPAFLAATAFALLRNGYNIAPVSPSLFPHLPSHGIRNVLSDTQGLVVSGGRNIRFDMSWMPNRAAGAPRPPYRRRPVGNVSVTTFTSGSTGQPKKFVQTDKALQQRFNSSLTSAGGEQSKVLIIPGLHSPLGFLRTCDVLCAGKTACFAPSNESALWLIEAFGIDCIVASPHQALALAEARAQGRGYKLESVTSILIDGALDAASAQRIKSRLCRHVVVAYGSSGMGTAAWAPYDAVADIPGAVGFVLPEVEIEIVDPTGKALPAGSEGIIRLRIRDAAANQDRESAGAMADKDSGWFCPGDIGRVTEHGVLCLMKSEHITDPVNGGRTEGP